MKIVTLTELLSIPGEVLFARYYSNHYVVGEFEIRSWTNESGDFGTTGPLSKAFDCVTTEAEMAALDDSIMNNSSISMDFNTSGGDRMFNHAAWFVVYEKHDVEKLIARLQQVVTSMP